MPRLALCDVVSTVIQEKKPEKLCGIDVLLSEAVCFINYHLQQVIRNKELKKSTGDVSVMSRVQAKLPK